MLYFRFLKGIIPNFNNIIPGIQLAYRGFPKSMRSNLPNCFRKFKRPCRVSKISVNTLLIAAVKGTVLYLKERICLIDRDTFQLRHPRYRIYLTKSLADLQITRIFSDCIHRQ